MGKKSNNPLFEDLVRKKATALSDTLKVSKKGGEKRPDALSKEAVAAARRAAGGGRKVVRGRIMPKSMIEQRSKSLATISAFSGTAEAVQLQRAKETGATSVPEERKAFSLGKESVTGIIDEPEPEPKQAQPRTGRKGKGKRSAHGAGEEQATTTTTTSSSSAAAVDAPPAPVPAHRYGRAAMVGEEVRRRREEREADRARRDAERAEALARREKWNKRLKIRTPKGQPIMSKRVDYMLDKIRRKGLATDVRDSASGKVNQGRHLYK
jgi:hypothetical protein